MFSFLVTAEGGLTTAGYLACILAGIIWFLLATFLLEKIL